MLSSSACTRASSRTRLSRSRRASPLRLGVTVVLRLTARRTSVP
ncbi:unnamed protein product [Brassica rapa]|uniref:Uncharacterized protein n=1 Tax=Brassica campestris TaxID=3711 RepID=A0A8D9H817_BRACM|nr:unnamed protein product [Brassica rapa]